MGNTSKFTVKLEREHNNKEARIQAQINGFIDQKMGRTMAVRESDYMVVRNYILGYTAAIDGRTAGEVQMDITHDCQLCRNS